MALLVGWLMVQRPSTYWWSHTLDCNFLGFISWASLVSTLTLLFYINFFFLIPLAKSVKVNYWQFPIKFNQMCNNDAKRRRYKWLFIWATSFTVWPMPKTKKYFYTKYPGELTPPFVSHTKNLLTTHLSLIQKSKRPKIYDQYDWHYQVRLINFLTRFNWQLIRLNRIKVCFYFVLIRSILWKTFGKYVCEKKSTAKWYAISVSIPIIFNASAFSFRFVGNFHSFSRSKESSFM